MELKQSGTTFEYEKRLLLILQNTRSGVIWGITKEKELRTFSDKGTPANDFTDDDTFLQCKCDISVVKNTFVNGDDIQMIASKFWCEC